MSAAPRTLDTVADLLAAAAALPPVARQVARARIDEALAGDARRCQAALGLLALELAPAAAAGRLADVAAVVDLDTGGTALEVAEDAPAVAHRQLRPRPGVDRPAPASSVVSTPHALTA